MDEGMNFFYPPFYSSISLLFQGFIAGFRTPLFLSCLFGWWHARSFKCALNIYGTCIFLFIVKCGCYHGCPRCWCRLCNSYARWQHSESLHRCWSRILSTFGPDASDVWKKKKQSFANSLESHSDRENGNNHFTLEEKDIGHLFAR